MVSRSRWLPGLACGALLAACAGESFVATEADFAGYRDWPHVAVDGKALSPSHPPGPRAVYFNRPLDAGPPYPVGMLIVKQMSADAGASSPDGGFADVFAMAKRGGGYNPDGAAGWEWFELSADPAAPVSILWRGEGPPLGEGYDAEAGGCNLCHAAAKSTDSVYSLTPLSP